MTTASATPGLPEGDPLPETDPGLRDRAEIRLKKRRDFQGHLVAYVCVNVLVWSIWAVLGATSGGWFPWPLFVTFGWGVGLVMNGWDVYLRRPITAEEIDREVDRMRSS